jgi:uncharacterized membrane protein YtjA (UPF0391 family)
MVVFLTLAIWAIRFWFWGVSPVIRFFADTIFLIRIVCLMIGIKIASKRRGTISELPVYRGDWD